MPYRRTKAQSLDNRGAGDDEDQEKAEGKAFMQALKFIVIGMGILIVLAVGLIGFGLYKKSVDPGWKLFGTRTDAPAAASAAPAMFGKLNLALPEGCRIEDVRPDGRRAFLILGPTSACDVLVVIDTQDGRILGRIDPR